MADFLSLMSEGEASEFFADLDDAALQPRSAKRTKVNPTKNQLDFDQDEVADSIRALLDGITASDLDEPLAVQPEVRPTVTLESLQKTLEEIYPESSKFLTDEQMGAVLDVANGKSIFISGSAGTGKSVTLRIIIAYLNWLYPPVIGQQCSLVSRVNVTAPTALAATSISGSTIHRFAGLVVDNTLDTEKAIRIVFRKKVALERWRMAKVIIIDEISMVGIKLFEILDTIAKRVNCNDLPFGGIQVVLSGDFCQLPPVDISDEGGFTGRIRSRRRGSHHYDDNDEDFDFDEDDIVNDDCSGGGSAEEQPRYCFQSKVWETVVPKTNVHLLTKNQRQKGDAAFYALLEELRMCTGTMSLSSYYTLHNRVVKDVSQLSDITWLLPTKKKVKERNNQCLLKLVDRPTTTFIAKDEPSTANSKTILNKSTLAEPALLLKIGAPVILVRNLSPSEGLVNGSKGVVIGFGELGTDSAPTGTTTNSKENRIISMEDPDALEYPQVKFDNGIVRHITEHTFLVMKGDEVVASRTQIPLILAWAMTIHKAQGMTLKSGALSLNGAFETGQIYTALSRFPSIDSIYITESFQMEGLYGVRIDRAVIKFYEDIKRARSPNISASNSTYEIKDDWFSSDDDDDDC